MNLYAFGYYATALLTIVVFIWFARKTHIRFASYSIMVFAFGLLLHVLPGYTIATGSAIRTVDRGFDLEVYWIYLAFTVALPIGLMLGRLLAGSSSVTAEVYSSPSLRMWLAAGFIVCYSILYLRWLGDAPLNYLVRSGDILGAFIHRMQSTHQLGERADLPLAFRYWRGVMQTWFLVVFLYLFQYLRGAGLARVLLVALAVAVAYTHLFTLEKAPFIYALAALFLLKSERVTNPRAILLFGGLVTVALYFLFVVFVGGGSDAWYGPLQQVLYRLQNQGSSVYTQILYVREHGALWLSGLDLQFARRFIDNGFIDLSVWAWHQLTPEYATFGIVGAAGGNAFAQLYFICSWLALPIFVCFVTIFAMVDQLFANTLAHGRISGQARMVLRSFYFALMPIMGLAFVGSVFTVFGLPMLLNSSLILLLMFLFLFVRPWSIRVIGTSAAAAGPRGTMPALTLRPSTA